MFIRSIQARIAASFAVLIVLLLAVTGITVASGGRIMRAFDRFGAAQRASGQVAAAAEQATMLQFRVAEYVSSERADDLKAAHLAQEALYRTIGALPVAEASQLDGAKAAAAALSGNLAEISRSIIARHGAGATLADNGSALSSMLTAVADSALRENDLAAAGMIGVASMNGHRASLFATRYLVSASPTDLAAAQADLGNVLAQLEELGMQAAPSSRLKRRLAAAVEQARSLGEAMGALELQTAARAAALPRLEATIGSLRSGLQELGRVSNGDADQAQATLRRQLRQAEVIVMSVAISALLLGLLCMLVIRRTCVSPLNDLVRCVRALAVDDLRQPVDHLGRADEIGDFAGALETLRQDALAAKVAAREAAIFADAASMERQRVVHESADATERALGEIARSVGDTAERLLSAADELNGIAGRTSSRAEDVVACSVQGHSRAEQVAVEADRLACLIGQTEARVVDAADVTATAARDAQESEKTVRSLSDAAAGVDEASRLIGQVARRTKLLALNASIEAARSGEAGRGFTVVANEVKALAAQTAAANEQIAREVDAMRAAADGSAAKINSVRDAISSVSQLTRDVAETFRQQQLFIQSFVEQAAESAASSGQMATAMQAVLDNAHEAARSADGLRQVAAKLAVQGSALHGELGKVVGELRAA